MTDTNNDFCSIQLGMFIKHTIQCDLANVEIHKANSIMNIADNVSQDKYCEILENSLGKKMVEIVKILESSVNGNILKKYNEKYSYYTTLCKLMELIYMRTTKFQSSKLKYNGHKFGVFTDYFTFIWFINVLLPLHKTFSKYFVETIRHTYIQNNPNIPTEALEYCKHIELMEHYAILTNTVPDFYNKYISDPYIEIISTHYEIYSQQEMSKCNIKEYIDKVIPIINLEADRAAKYFKPEVRLYVLDACKKFSIIRYMDFIEEEFIRLIKTEDLKQLKSIYDVLVMLNINITNMQDAAIRYIKENCLGLITPDESDFGYIDLMISIHDKYINMYKLCFTNDARAQSEISSVMSSIINRNAVVKDDRDASIYLAKVMDKFIKKPNVSDEKEKINDFIKIFRHIIDKDAFAAYYKNNLSKRLLKISDDRSIELENYTLEMMKKLQGNDYIQKMQRMISDLLSSKSITDGFKETEIYSSLSCKFDIKLLTSGTWPLQPAEEFTLPEELYRCITLFTAYYDNTNARRKLLWNLQYSHGELAFKSEKKTFKLKVSTQQIAILMKFNNSIEYSVDDLVKFTNISKEYIEANMALLCKAKIIILNGEKYTLNIKYNGKDIIINLNVPIAIDKTKEKDAIDKNIEKDREFVIQSIIVRIMKTKKTLKHQDLISEVIKQLINKFSTKIPIVKKQIDLLIEKEYLRRIEDTKDEYEYLA